MKWFKSNHNVENPAQAGDASLYLYYGEGARVHTETNDRPNYISPYNGTHSHIEFYGVYKEKKQIPIENGRSLLDVIWENEINPEGYSHIVLVELAYKPDNYFYGGTDIYRLYDNDKNCIKNKVGF